MAWYGVVHSRLLRTFGTLCRLTAGCDTIRWNFTRGLNDTRGAAFVLNVGFQQSAGSLQQISADSISKAPILTLMLAVVMLPFHQPSS